jgi:hypothetical protein
LSYGFNGLSSSKQTTGRYTILQKHRKKQTK